MNIDRSPKKREERLAWLLENALAYIRGEHPRQPDMHACWLLAHGEKLLKKKSWDDFEWRYDGS